MTKVNIGCGQTPTPGWKNYDNSLSIRLAKLPFLFWVLKKIGVLEKPTIEFILFVIKNDIKYADATKHIPEPDHSVDVLYSSHMLDRLCYDEAKLFLREARRILTHGGIIRISVPDIKLIIENYIKNGNANSLMERIQLARKKPRTFWERVKYIIIGSRHRLWMYDGASLCNLFSLSGFSNPQIMEKGQTNILDSGGLDLFERGEESVYVEAINP